MLLKSEINKNKCAKCRLKEAVEERAHCKEKHTACRRMLYVSEASAEEAADDDTDTLIDPAVVMSQPGRYVAYEMRSLKTDVSFTVWDHQRCNSGGVFIYFMVHFSSTTTFCLENMSIVSVF